MTNTIYDRIQRTLSWRKVIAFNALLFMVTVIPLSLRIAREDTENRSGAASGPVVPVVTPPPAYPQEAPRIDRVSEFFGKRGDTVVILGSNFGDYQWGSSLYVGDVAASDSDIVRWSNAVVEVQIPEEARTGKVWIVVNGRRASWDGSLLLYDVNRAAQTGIRRVGSVGMEVWLERATGVVRGMVEIAQISEPLTAQVVGGRVVQLTQTSDSLGKKTRIEFALDNPLTSNLTTVLTIQYPGIGALEIIRVELYDASDNLVSVYADPLKVRAQ